jgi:flavin-dependent dehydrogenase
MSRPYDVIVVGARCAGSPTAMLLAQKGYRVLLLDRASFPSDTVSTHIVHPLAVAAMSRWGLYDRLIASGCPPIDTYAFDFGPFTIEGAPGTNDHPLAYCPRRTILDKLLIDAAADAGAEVREDFSVDKVSMEGDRIVGIEGRSRDGKSFSERAQIVIGADGRNSIVADAAHAETYNTKPPLLAIYYAYYSSLPMPHRLTNYVRDRRGFAAAETHGGLTMVVGGWPYAEFATNKDDIEGHFLKMFELAPSFSETVRGARRETRFAGMATPNFFRKPFGPGWALVGDAGYLKDPITAQGILDAFRDAERCAIAVGEALSGRRAFDAAMSDHQRDRDSQVTPMYDFTCQLALLEPPSSELQQLLGAVHGNQDAMDQFAQVNAGTISPATFFSTENVGAIMAARR